MSIDVAKFAQYEKDAPPAMSRFQIERFVLGTQPPTERYFICCTQIQSRLADLRGLLGKLSNIKDGDPSRAIMQRMIFSVERELEIFHELADIWKPMTRGLGYEELQQQIWDERLCYRLCLVMISGSPISTCIEEVMAMPEGSKARQLLTFLVHGEGGPDQQQQIQRVLTHYESPRPMIGVEDDKQAQRE